MHSATVSRFFTLFIAGIMLMPSATYSKINATINTTSFTGAYLAGRVANHENKTDLAINYFKQALAHKPDNIETQKELLEAMLSVGTFKEAVQQAKKLKEQDIITPFVSLTLSVESLIRGDYENAKLLLQLKVPPESNNPIIELIGAWVTFGSGQKSQAIADLEKIKGPAWYDLFIRYHLALMSDLAGRTQDAKKYFIQALNNKQGTLIAPNTYERIIIAYASFQLRHKMRNQALQTLKHGEQMLSGREALKNIREKVEKNASLEKLVKTPQQGAGEVLYNFGTALNYKNSGQIARIFKQLSFALYPQNDATLFQLANISTKLGNPNQAIKLYRALPYQSPYYRDGQLQLAFLLANNNNYSEAIKLLSSLKKKFPNDRAVLITLAAFYIQDNKFVEATQMLDQTIAQIKNFQREDWKLFYQRGIAFEHLQQWTKAEIDLRKALEFFPDQPQILNYLGYSLVERGEKLEESLHMLKKASTLQPQNSYILDSLGWAYYKLKQYNQAVQILENAVKLHPEDPTLNDHLGDAYWQVGRKREAIFQWNHAIDGEAKNSKEIQKKLKLGLQ
ncbi:tetratricopeptide repeat protein [Bartonella taylorii]|uniref:Tetratricopeptide repeat protein n=1 Tax=Bartonella taylorii TaxID=33046 RepID=A0A9Q8YXJ4_BARTA|nr:tetratricopeptide repeat protein [Bartonella taylorii]OPB35305.1 Tetratricopeptide repeat-containing protein [Bartonella taylorii]USP02779.1 tetratricopeptide repeat protein [Bartonella taylorii]